MTDQSKPDRQDGEGLSREQVLEYIRELNTIAAECEIAGTSELSRAAHNLYRIAKRWFKSLPVATPQPRDAAEGADPCHGPEDTTCPSCGLGSPWLDFNYAAPPKPAPDAMRSPNDPVIAILNSVEEIARYLRRADPAAYNLDDYTELLCVGLKKLRAALSAPVLPADGPTKKYKCPHCGEMSDVPHDSACGVW